MKRLLRTVVPLLFTVLLLVACQSPDTTEETGRFEHFIYQKENDGITILGYSGIESTLTVPDKIEGLPVKKIGKNAFRGFSFLTSITLPDSVTVIDSAFVGCTDLTEAHVGAGIQSMALAFQNCTSLVTVTGAEKAEILDYAFQNCTSLKAATIPATAKSAVAAYADCTSLDRVTIREGITSLDSTFRGCLSLAEIVLPSSVTEAVSTFEGCILLDKIEGGAGLTVMKDTFRGCTQLRTVTLGPNVTELSGVFCGCSLLKTVENLPREVERYAPSFVGCYSLTSAVIPKITNEGALSSYDLSQDLRLCESLKTLEILSVIPTKNDFCKTFAGLTALESLTLPTELLTFYFTPDVSYVDTLFEGENASLSYLVDKYRKESLVRFTNDYGYIGGVGYAHLYGGDLDVFEVDTELDSIVVAEFAPYEKISYWCGYPSGGNRALETVGIQRTWSFFLRASGKNEGELPALITVNGMSCRVGK